MLEQRSKQHTYSPQLQKASDQVSLLQAKIYTLTSLQLEFNVHFLQLTKCRSLPVFRSLIALCVLDLRTSFRFGWGKSLRYPSLTVVIFDGVNNGLNFANFPNSYDQRISNERPLPMWFPNRTRKSFYFRSVSHINLDIMTKFGKKIGSKTMTGKWKSRLTTKYCKYSVFCIFGWGHIFLWP